MPAIAGSTMPNGIGRRNVSVVGKRRQTMARARLPAAHIARLHFPTRSRPRRVNAAAHPAPDFTFQRHAMGLGGIGAAHARMPRRQPFLQWLRQPALGGLGPVERHPETGAARAALLAGRIVWAWRG